MQLQKELETPFIELLHVSDSLTYESSYSFLEFLKAMSEVLEDKIWKDLESAAAITLLVDESTDITIK